MFFANHKMTAMHIHSLICMQTSGPVQISITFFKMLFHVASKEEDNLRQSRASFQLNTRQKCFALVPDVWTALAHKHAHQPFWLTRTFECAACKRVRIRGRIRRTMLRFLLWNDLLASRVVQCKGRPSVHGKTQQAISHYQLAIVTCWLSKPH